jgi:ATP-binding cassette, subfamily B, multidrug efflux pump
LFKKLYSLIPYVRRCRGALLDGILTLIAASVCSASIPFLIKLTVDNMESGLRHKVPLLLGITALLALLQAALKYRARTRILNSSRQIEFEMRRDFFTHLVSLPYAFFRNQHRGDLIARIMNDIGNVRMMVGMGILHFSSAIATTLLSLIMMMRLSPLITLLAIFPLLFLFLFIKRSMDRLHTIFTESQEAYGRLSKGVNDVLGGIRVVKNYLLHEKESRRFESLNAAYMEKNLAATRVWGLVFPSIGFLGGLGTLLVMWAGGYALMEKRITLGDFIALNTYYMMLMWPIAALGWILNLYQRGLASLKRVEAIRQSPAEDEEGIVFHSPTEGITFQGVGLMKEGCPILKEITFTVARGEKVLILGPTGSGKSTLLNLLTLLEEGYTGRITIDGVELRAFSRPSVRRRIAVVPQDPFLYSQSIRENILSPDNPEPLLIAVRMKDEIERFNDGTDTVVGERGVTLSGGQKQRLTLARALAARPEILLLDDPFTHVDQLTEEMIWRGMGPLIAPMTLIMTSTRPVALGRIDRVLVLDEGRLIDEGRPREVLQRDSYMKLLYQVRATDG